MCGSASLRSCCPWVSSSCAAWLRSTSEGGMDHFVKLVTGRDFLIAVLAAVSVAAVVFTLGAQFLVRSDMKERIKRVALEREKLRAEEMARLRGQQEGRGSVRREDLSSDYMK